MQIHAFALLCGALVATGYHAYTVTQERDYLKTELHVDLGVAERATVLTSEAQEIAVRYQLEIDELRAEQDRVKIAAYIKHVNKQVDSDRISRAIIAASKIHDIDPYLITAMIRVESYFIPTATGSSGEKGLMQIMKSTAESIGHGCWTYEVETNILCGVSYLKSHIGSYRTQNGAVTRYNGGGDPAYAVKVSNAYNRVKTWKV